MLKKHKVSSFFKNINYINTTIIILSASASVYILHRITNGAILQSKLLTLLTFLFFLPIFALPLWPWMKFKPQIQKENIWIVISLLSILVIIWLWGGETEFNTDYKKFKMFSMQLQNGFAKPHYFYSDSPINYPPVSITLVTIISNIFYLSVHRSIFIYSLILAFFFPLATYRLGRVINLDKKTSLFFACLISLYGGFFSESLARLPLVYLTAPQIMLHYIARALNLFVFLIFLAIWFKVYGAEQRSYKLHVILGITVGLMGLIHPQAYVIGMLYLSVLLITDFINNRILKYNLLSLSIALGISILFWGEVLYEMILGFGSLSTQSGPSLETYPTKVIEFLILYGPLLLIAVISFKRKEKWELWKVVSLISIFSLVAYRVILSMIFPGKEVLIFRINRFGPYIFFFLALLSCGGIARLLKKKKNLIIALMAAIVLIGYISNICYLKKYFKKEPARFSNLFSKNYVQDGIHEVERLRHLVSDPQKTMIVPVYWTQKVAWETGLDVPWVSRTRIAFNKFTERTMSQDDRYNNVQKFYEELNKNVFRKDILKLFGAECFLAGQKHLEKKFQIVLLEELEIPRKKIKNGKKMKKWYLYEIKKL